MHMRLVVLSWMALVFCAAPVVARDLRIEHVTVVSPERTSPLRDAVVTVKGDRIVAVGPGGKSAKKAQILDGTGLYLTPGLIDSHVHTSDLPITNPFPATSGRVNTLSNFRWLARCSRSMPTRKGGRSMRSNSPTS